MLVTSPPKKVIKKLHVPQNSTSKKKTTACPAKNKPSHGYIHIKIKSLLQHKAIFFLSCKGSKRGNSISIWYRLNHTDPQKKVIMSLLLYSARRKNKTRKTMAGFFPIPPTNVLNIIYYIKWCCLKNTTCLAKYNPHTVERKVKNDYGSWKVGMKK